MEVLTNIIKVNTKLKKRCLCAIQSIFNKTYNEKTEIGLWIYDSGSDWNDILILSIMLENIDSTFNKIYLEYNDILFYIKKKNLSKAYLEKPKVNGKDICSITKIQGKHIGVILREILRMQFNNRIITKQEIIEYLLKYQ